MRAYDNNVRADRFLDEHKKSSKNSNLQKILLITCKNSSRKPLKSRVPRGYRRNESKPVEGIDTINELIADVIDFSVEMKVSPLRALTQLSSVLKSSLSFVEMKVSPLRALTHPLKKSILINAAVEMKVSPLRALTLVGNDCFHMEFFGRNESKPVEGIDTLRNHRNLISLTGRNESKPVEGIDT